MKISQEKLVYLSLLVALGSILFIVENLVQFSVLWFRLGIANVMTLLALKWWGLKEGIIVLIFRVLIGSLLSGRFLSPLFIMAICGGLTSTLAMWFTLQLSKKFIGLVGVSIVGALIKNTTQLGVAYLAYIRQIEIFNILPVFILMSLVTGFLIGFLAILINNKLSHTMITSEFR